MIVNKFGIVTDYTQQDLNHCYSPFYVIGCGFSIYADCLAAAIRIRRENDERDAVIKAVNDVWTWDNKRHADRLFYRAATGRVGFDDD